MKKLISISLILGGMIIQAEARVETETYEIPTKNVVSYDIYDKGDKNSGGSHTGGGSSHGGGGGGHTYKKDPRTAISINKYVQFSESEADKKKIVFRVAFNKRLKEDITLKYDIYPKNGLKIDKDIIAPSGFIKVNKGAKNAKIVVSVINDKDVEDAEYFVLKLKKPSSDYKFWRRSSKGIILDDEISLEDIDTDGNYAIKEHKSKSDKITTKNINKPFKIDVDAKAGFEILTDKKVNSKKVCSNKVSCSEVSYGNNGKATECVKDCTIFKTVSLIYSDKMDVDRVLLHTYDEYDKGSDACINERSEVVLSHKTALISGENFSLDILPKVATPCAWIEVRGKSQSEYHKRRKSFVGKSDTFAIKPDHFVLPKNLVAKAGEDKPFAVLAVDLSNKLGKSYNEVSGKSFTIDASQINGACSYDSDDFKLDKLNQFFDGNINNGTISYNSVGNLKLTIHEIKDNEFASIDRGDTPDVKRYIKPDTTTMKFVPFDFDTTVAYSNNHTKTGYAFYSNDLNNGPTWKIGASAINKDGDVLENYDSACFSENADKVSFDIDLNVSSNGDLDLISSIGGDTIDSKSKSLRLKSKLPGFKKGKSSTKVTINFDRDKMTPKAPAVVKVNDVEIKDPDNVTNIVTNIEPLVGAKYQYMRAYIQDPVAVVGKNELKTKVYYETYIPSHANVVGVTNGKNSISGDRDWKRVDYDNRSGKMAFLNPTQKYSSPNRSNPTNDANIRLKVVTKNIPERNKITMRLNPEFRYITDYISTNVSFIPDTVEWAGEGKTGMVVDTEVAARSSFKKMGW